MNKIKKGAVLVAAGTCIMGIAYIPVNHKKAKPEVVAAYLAGKNTYNPYKSESDWKRSQDRKQELMSQIQSIRKQIRIQAEIYRIDATTTIAGVTASQKTVVHSTKLMNQICKAKLS